jgi:hypothetical protein
VSEVSHLSGASPGSAQSGPLVLQAAVSSPLDVSPVTPTAGQPGSGARGPRTAIHFEAVHLALRWRLGVA